MRKLFLLLVVIMGTLVSFAQNNKFLSQDEAWKIVFNQVLNGDTTNVNVYISKSPIQAQGKTQAIGTDEQYPNNPSWFVFVDDFPFANWEHPCRFVYVDISTGITEVQTKKMGPSLENMDCIVRKSMPVSKEPLDIKQNIRSATDALPLESAVHDYAVIINGGKSPSYNGVRFWNDCSYIYKTLVEKFGYDKSHIYSLISDGTDPANDRILDNGTFDSSPLDLDGDGVNDVYLSATRSNLFSVFNDLSEIITEDDNLFIFIDGHGGQVTGMQTYFFLWNEEKLYDYEFASMLNNLSAKQVNVFMEPCNSGGFIDDLQASNRTITTACRYDEASTFTINSGYNDFAYLWITANRGLSASGTSVNADFNDNGTVSFSEAYTYACFFSSRPEHPQFSSLSSAKGEYASLYNPFIVGTTYVCDSSFYSIEPLPSNVTVDWRYHHYNNPPHPVVTPDSNHQNHCAIRNPYKYPLDTNLMAFVKLGTDTVDVFKKRVICASTNWSYKYHQDECYFHGVHHSAINEITVSNTTPQFVHQGCLVTLEADWFEGRIVTHSGATPDTWFRLDNRIYFSLPYGSGGIPFYIFAEGQDGACDHQLLFFSYGGNSVSQTYNLTVTPSSEGYVFSIIGENGDNKQIVEVNDWKLEVYSTSQMKKIYTEDVEGQNCNLLTSGWQSGTYIVTAVVGKERISEKIVIK